MASPEFFDLVTVTPESPRSGEGDMAVLSDGRLLFVYGHFAAEADDARASLVQRYSSDGGRTWTAPEELIPASEALQNVMSVSLLRLQSGGLLLFYLRKDGPDRCRAWLRRSDDEAASWTEATCVTPNEAYHIIVNNCALQLPEGRVILPYQFCPQVLAAQARIDGAVAYSDDDGATWSHSNQLQTIGRGVMETRVIPMADQRLRMFSRTDQGCLHMSQSSDRGQTWGPFTATAIESPQAPFALTAIPGTGDWLLIWNPHADLAASAHQGFRTPLRCAVSSDGGQTWRHAKDLESDLTRSYCYVSVTWHEDTAVLSYYVGSREMMLEGLRVARVPVAWFYE